MNGSTKWIDISTTPCAEDRETMNIYRKYLCMEYFYSRADKWSRVAPLVPLHRLVRSHVTTPTCLESARIVNFSSFLLLTNHEEFEAVVYTQFCTTSLYYLNECVDINIYIYRSITPHSTQANHTAEVRKPYIVQLATDGWDSQIWERGESECPYGRADVPKFGRPLVCNLPPRAIYISIYMYLFHLSAHHATMRPCAGSMVYSFHLYAALITGSPGTDVKRQPCHTVCHHARW